MATKTFLRAALILAVMAGPVWGQVEEVVEVDELDISNFPGALVEDVVVPVPSEVFMVLDKLGDPDWGAELYEGEYSGYTDRTQLALVFGTAVADGFVAVQAKDRAGIQRLGREVLRLGEAIGIRDAVVGHCNSIIESANDEDWKSIRRELDRTQSTVRTTMERMRDEDLAQAVSIGGWLRGTEVITSLITGAYSKDKAELLSQPDLVAYFGRSIDDMDEDVKGNEKMVAVGEGLEIIRKLMDNGDEVLDADEVTEMQEVCARLLGLVRESGSGGGEVGGGGA
ncbi:MAG: hypothetical protein AAF591_20840 [Verrucomicrobiota bacterium]